MSTTYSYIKTVNSLRLQEEVIAAGLSTIQYIDTSGSNVNLVFSSELTSEQISTLTTVVGAHQVLIPKEYIRSVREAAMEFGAELMNVFIEENIEAGITSANMTNITRKRLKEVKDALITGSLKDAIYELRQIPLEDKDGIYINDVRILAVINKIEAYLGLPLSTEV